jgi:hypothetical protein
MSADAVAVVAEVVDMLTIRVRVVVKFGVRVSCHRAFEAHIDIRNDVSLVVKGHVSEGRTYE